jgi:hypothetical protein
MSLPCYLSSFCSVANVFSLFVGDGFEWLILMHASYSCLVFFSSSEGTAAFGKHQESLFVFVGANNSTEDLLLGMSGDLLFTGKLPMLDLLAIGLLAAVESRGSPTKDSRIKDSLRRTGRGVSSFVSGFHFV